MEDIESLSQQLEELKALRRRLVSVDNAEELSEDSADIREYLKDEIELIEKEIEDIEEETKKTAKEYEKTYKELKDAIDEYEKKLNDNNLLSEDEIAELRYSAEKHKIEINEVSIELKRRLDDQKKMIRALKAKKTTIEKNINKSIALGLTYSEYKEITSTLRKTKIMNSILEKEGLSSIIEKSAKERTKEENDILKKTKEEILIEISEYKKENKESNVLEIIEVFYSLDTTYIEKKKPRVMKIKKEDLNNIKGNSNTLPHKIKSSVNNDDSGYTPAEQPKDMKDANQNQNVDLENLKPVTEKVTLFKDTETGEYYARKYAVDKFKLTSADLGSEVKIDGSICYKISLSDVNRIKENANKSSGQSYIADIKEIKIEKDKYKASNVKASKKFKKELKEGNVLYNIVHTVPKIIKIVADKIRHAQAMYEMMLEPEAAKTDNFTHFYK